MSQPPFFSICIPQHNRTSFLIEACRSIVGQSFREFEICISDDCSTDGRDREVVDFLEASGMPFVFRRRETNGRYDRNLRSATDLARGDFLLLLGNDDALRTPETLQEMFDLLTVNPATAVFLTNFEDWTTGAVTRRVQRTGRAGAGPRVAVSAFRKFSFVSGIVFRRDAAAAARTEAWDGTEMYQMYVGCRIIAAGGSLFEADITTVRKDIQISGEAVENFAARPWAVTRGVPVQPIPVSRVAALVADAVEPYVASDRRGVFLSLVVQYYGFLYPYWLFVYRRVRSWRFAAGVSRAFAPSSSLAGTSLPISIRVVAWVCFAISTLLGLVIPVKASSYLLAPARWVARVSTGTRRPVAGAGRS